MDGIEYTIVDVYVINGKIFKNMIKKEIINIWNKKRGIIENISYGNPISIALYKNDNSIKEGLIRTYPIEKSKEYLIKLYGFDDSQVEIINDNGVEKLRFILPDNTNITSKVKKAMDLCGYFCSVEKEYPYIDKWVYLNFEPKNQDDVNNYVRNMKEIYHVTQEKNIDKITKIGLTPRFKNPLFSYPERVYLFVEETPSDEIYGLTKQLKTVKNNTYKHYLIVLNVEKIPDDVTFFLDPNYGYCIFTKDNIPPSAIKEIYEMII